MKRIVLSLLLIAFIFPAVSNAQSNNLKFGHINVSELMGQMPERDTIRQELQEYQKMLQNEIQTLQQEYSQKVQSYQENQGNFSDMVRRSKERELQDMQQRIQEFQSTAQQDFQRKQQELLEPLMNRIDSAIKKVGQEKGFIYIFDTSAGAVAYKSQQSQDVMPMVKEELGIQ